MSALSAAKIRSSSVRIGAQPQVAMPTLSVIRPQKRIRSNLPLIAMVILLLTVLIVVPLLLHTQMAVTSYAMHEEQVALNRISAENDTLRQELEQAASAQKLAELARNIGMVPAGETGYITLASQAVEGGIPATTIVP